MSDREGQVWEAKGIMNGVRIVIVVGSRPGSDRYGECTVHRVFHASGAKEGRILEWTEQGSSWDATPGMTRLT